MKTSKTIRSAAAICPISLRRMLVPLGVALSLAAALTPARAEYPERPISMVIPYSAGGATDISARALAAPLGRLSPKPLLMVNRTGAGGATGSVAVKNAKSDGYTLLFARVGSHAVSPAMKATLPYTLDDFRFVGVYEINPVVCAVSVDSPIKSMEDLAAQVKAAPGKISFSSAGVGSLLHLASAMALKEFGVDNPATQVIHLPLKGGGDAATAVIAGTANFICTNSSEVASFVQNKQMRPLMVTTPERLAGFDAPSAVELGKPKLTELVGWTGIAGPRDLPDDVAKTWGEWLAKATTDEQFQRQMSAAGSVIRLMTPEESNQFIRRQYETFRQLVDELGMRIEG